METDLLGLGVWAGTPVAIIDGGKVTCNSLSLTALGPTYDKVIGKYSSPCPSSVNMERCPPHSNMNLHEHVLAEGAKGNVAMLDRFLNEIPTPLPEHSVPRRAKRSGNKYLLGG